MIDTDQRPQFQFKGTSKQSNLTWEREYNMEKKTLLPSFIGEKDIGLLLDSQISQISQISLVGQVVNQMVAKPAKKKDGASAPKKTTKAVVVSSKPNIENGPKCSTPHLKLEENEMITAISTMTYLEALIEGAKPGPFFAPGEDLDPLFLAIPGHILEKHNNLKSWSTVVELVFDLGRKPYYLSVVENSKSLHKTVFSEHVVDDILLTHISSHVGEFSQSDNRAGISGTLHRISRKLNRSGSIIGLTIRIGRSIDGLHVLLKKELDLGKSTLLLGKPGLGKRL